MKLSAELTKRQTLYADLTPGRSLGGSLSMPQLKSIEPATESTLGGVIVGRDLNITEQGVLSVTKANSVEEDNTHPITAAAVFVEVGNINVLLETI